MSTAAEMLGRQDADAVLSAIVKGGRCMAPAEAGMLASEAINTLLGGIIEGDFEPTTTGRLDGFAERIGELLWWLAVGRIQTTAETF